MKKIRQSKVFFTNIWMPFIATVIYILYSEAVLHFAIYRSLDTRFIYLFGFSLVAAAVIFTLIQIVPKKCAGIFACVFLGLLTVYFEIQFVYHSIFSEFMPLWQFSMGTDAVTNFWRQMLYGIWNAILPIVLLLLPFVILLVAVKKRWLRFQRISWIIPACSVVLVFAFHFLTVGVMYFMSHGVASVYEIYADASTPTETCVRNIGLLPAAVLELKYLAFGTESEAAGLYVGDKVSIDIDEQSKYNMEDIRFDELSQATENALCVELDSYFETVTPQLKNEYTGLCEGYNLIMICAESFSPYCISEELTPTLWELTHNGFIFHNYYGTFSSNTTNGEYTLNVGLFPDLSRKKSLSSMVASADHYLPYCLGTQFTESGARAYAYHDYLGEYYNRDITHPNLGYDFKAVKSGLDMDVSWPASDLEMMKLACSDFCGSERFCAYFMTFSGHYQYDWQNAMSAKNREKVEHLPYSDTVKAYIACNLELEYALAYLQEQLCAAGIDDKTVIVLTNDHYPYGLSEDEYNELAGKSVDTEIEKYRNSFICYVPGVQKEVDAYCSTVDILPTLLNLFGFEYDSRLLVGRDVLSADRDNLAILFDGSIVSDTFSYIAGSGEIRLQSNTETTKYAEYLIQQTKEKFDVSAKILECDYYAHVYSTAHHEENPISKYEFTDLPDTVEFGAVRMMIDNNLMSPRTDEYFGFSEIASYPEFLNTVYELTGAPDTSGISDDYRVVCRALNQYNNAAKWAYERGYWDDTLTYIRINTPLTLSSYCLILSKYAKNCGVSIHVDEKISKQYQSEFPNLTKEEIESILWCYDNQIPYAYEGYEETLALADYPLRRIDVMLGIWRLYNGFIRE